MSGQYENCFNSATYYKNHTLNGLKLVSQFCKTNRCNKVF
jgi:hypothetical protein